MSQSQSQPDLEELVAAKKARANFLYVQFQTELRNLILCYLHALTQSKYKLEFFENGSIKSIAPKGKG